MTPATFTQTTQHTSGLIRSSGRRFARYRIYHRPKPDIQKVLNYTIQFSAVDGDDAAVANKQGWWRAFALGISRFGNHSNIFSYPANLAQLQAAYPNLAVLSNPQTFATDAHQRSGAGEVG